MLIRAARLLLRRYVPPDYAALRAAYLARGEEMRAEVIRAMDEQEAVEEQQEAMEEQAEEQVRSA